MYTEVFFFLTSDSEPTSITVSKLGNTGMTRMTSVREKVLKRTLYKNWLEPVKHLDVPFHFY